MLHNYDETIKVDIFKDETTYRNDYRNMGHVSRKMYTWPKDRSEPPQKTPPKEPIIDKETYQPWRDGVYIPFNLLWEAKPIIGHNPHEPFILPHEIIDEGKENAIKTRPRVYMSPAVSIDDVPDPEMRKLLCQHMYTTEWNKATREAAWPTTERIAPNTTVEKGDLVGLTIDIHPPLDGKLRAKGNDWDIQQTRACVDPTRTFWLTKDPPMKCGACVNPYKGLVPTETKEEITRLIKEDKLRLAHDVVCPSYDGYRPQLSAGVSLEKVKMPITHPMITCLQAITSRYAENK